MSALFELRRLAPADLPELSAVAVESFIEAFRDIDPMAELVIYCENNLSIEALRPAIEDPRQAFFGLFVDEKIGGYLHLVFEKNEKGEHDSRCCHLRRIYLLQKHIGQKMGKALMEKAVEEAKKQGARRIWLVVYYQNFAAQAFYKSFGMREAGIFEFDFNGTIHLDPIFDLEIF